MTASLRTASRLGTPGETSARTSDVQRGGGHGRRPQARRAARDRGGLRRDRGAGRLQGAGRAARARRLARRPSATTWPRWRTRATSTSPTPAPAGCPTDKGYRLFVDKLATLKPMSAAERRAIATLLDGAVDLDDVVQRSVRLLSQLTRQVAIVQYPTLSRSTVRHIELVVAHPDPGDADPDPQHRPGRAAPRRARRRRWPTPTSPSCGSRSTRPAPGCRSPTAAAALGDLPDGVRPEQADVDPRDRGRARRGDVRPPQRRAGRGRRHRQPGPLRRLRHRRPTRSSRRWRSTSCCSSCSGSRAADAVTVRIGHEGPYSELAATSVVATGYGPQELHLGSARRGRADPHGLPRIHGSRARGRALRLPDPR